NATLPFVCTFICLALAYLIFKKRLPTVIFGALAGFIVNFIIGFIVNFFTDFFTAPPDSGRPGINLLFSLIRFFSQLIAGVSFCGVWYLLLSLADEGEAEDKFPCI